jgi:XapX domain-containing protein
VKIYLLSVAAGVLVGILYGLLNVRSPAPPVVALLGLLGILVGEQVTAAAKRHLNGKPVNLAWVKTECAAHVLGHPIGCPPPAKPGPAVEPDPGATV